MTCFLYQLLTYFLSKAYLLMAIIRHLSFREIYFLYHRFLQVLARRVLFGYPSKCYFEHCIKKTGFSDICKISSGFFYFTYPSLEFKGVFFLNTFCLTPVLLFVCPSSNVFLSDFLSRTISNFNQIWQSIVEEL